MIVDVLRNDLGRVCRPGSVRVPRLCRLERTAAVQHLVSTVTGVLADGRDAFDLLAASFPGGSITGAPKIRAMEILEGLEPVRRGPYTGRARLDRAGRRDADEHPHPHVRRRRPAADAPRRRRHHLERATRPPSGTRPSPRRAARWARSAGSRSHDRPSTPGRLGHVWVDGRLLPADGRTCRRSIAGSSSATGCSRRSAPAAAARPSSPSTSPGSGAPRAGSRSPCRPTSTRRWPRGIPTCSPPRASTAPTATPRSGSRSSRGAFPGRGVLPPDEVAAADDRHPGLAGRAAARPATSSAACTSSPPPSGATRPARWRRSRRRRAPNTSSPGSRPAGPAPTTRSS